MNISQEVIDALLYDEGLLGEIYGLVRDIEDFDTKAVEIFTKMTDLQDC